jgi:hypothetical protein
MKKFVILGALAILALTDGPAQAGPGAPFCRRVNGGAWQGAHDDCSYFSFEQCRMSSIGVGGFCVQNPYYARVAEPRRLRRHHAYRY